jgi:type II restriction enzyme
MSLTNIQKIKIENILKEALRTKFENYKPESASMPFHTRLLGKDRMALFSFIHSLNTNFGITIFEPIALELAKTNFKITSKHAEAGTQISDGAQKEIQNDRWTMAGMLDLSNELKVADEFWDFLNGEGAYKDLLNCFERVGIELRDEIDNYFKKYNNL